MCQCHISNRLPAAKTKLNGARRQPRTGLWGLGDWATEPEDDFLGACGPTQFLWVANGCNVWGAAVWGSLWVEVLPPFLHRVLHGRTACVYKTISEWMPNIQRVLLLEVLFISRFPPWDNFLTWVFLLLFSPVCKCSCTWGKEMCCSQLFRSPLLGLILLILARRFCSSYLKIWHDSVTAAEWQHYCGPLASESCQCGINENQSRVECVKSPIQVTSLFLWTKHWQGSSEKMCVVIQLCKALVFFYSKCNISVFRNCEVGFWIGLHTKAEERLVQSWQKYVLKCGCCWKQYPQREGALASRCLYKVRAV